MNPTSPNPGSRYPAAAGRPRPSRRLLVGLTLGGGIAAALLIYYFYKEQVRWIRQEQTRALVTIADIKTSAIASWRRERLADARGVPLNPPFARLVRQYLSNPVDPAAESGIRYYFELLKSNHAYSAILLFDADGLLRLSSDPVDDSFEPGTSVIAVEAVKKKTVIFEDFHSHDGKSFHLAVVGPVYEGRSAPVGAIEFHIDPAPFLYRQLQAWPAPGYSGEALLVRREGNEVVFLNELRHQKNTAMKLRMPLDVADLPAAQAVSGHEGPVEGKDYRGVPVMAAVRWIPDSPWYLVAKIDRSEAFGDLRSRTRYFAAVTLLVLVLSEFAVLLAWSRRDSRYYRQRYAAEAERISERKRAEEVLIESQTRLKLALQAANLGTWELDLARGIISASPQTLAVFGFESDPQAFADWMKRIHPDDRERVEAELRGKSGPMSRYDVEYRTVAKDGTVRWVLSQGARMSGDKDRPDRIIGVAQDITLRKQAEQALRESEERFRAAFDHAAIGMVLVSLDGHLTSVNSAFCEILGYTRDELVGIHVNDITHPEDIRTGADAVHRMLAGKEQRAVFEKRFMKKSGFVVLAQVLSAVLRGGTDSPIGFILQVHDITERRRAEEALRESQADLKRAQAVAHTGSWRLDVPRNQLTVSDETCRIFGMSREGRLTSEAFLEMVHPGDRDHVDRAWHAAMTGEPYDIEHRIAVEGRVKWVHERAELEFDQDKVMIAAFGTIQDITDQKRAEEEILRLNAELEQRVRHRTAELEAANRELEAFAYSVSHDLRAPLRGVDGWSLAILEDCSEQLDDRGRLYLERVRSEAQRMGVLIDDLLQLSRLNRTEMQRQRVDLSRVAETIAARLSEEHAGRRIEFTVQPGMVAAGDPRLLEVALTNLLDNAVKFTGTRPHARVDVGQVQRDGEILYYVRDNGVGFDMAYAGTLFGPFQRLHKISEFPGTGIGLATVQRVIHRHGGHVWAAAEPDRGATFYFSLGSESEVEQTHSSD